MISAVTSASSENGKALEKMLVDYIIAQVPEGNVSLTAQTTKFQKQDEKHVVALSDNMQVSHMDYVEQIFRWLEDEFSISSKCIVIHRLNDTEARKGDVTDVRISIDGEDDINLSLKHNHSALKHQRPPSVAQWMGMPKRSEEDQQYRVRLTGIIDHYLQEAERICPGAVMFREVDAVDPGIKTELLYRAVCTVVTTFIQEHCVDNTDRVRLLFDFLVGTIPFYKVHCSRGVVTISDFRNVEKPNTLTVGQHEDKNVVLRFSNNWHINMRLHTASSRIGGSLKFDTQLQNADEVLTMFVSSNG